MKKEQPKLSPIRKKFNEQYREISESEIKKEMLFYQKIANQKLEKIRSNTSNLVWFLIVIPIIIGILAVVFMS